MNTRKTNLTKWGSLLPAVVLLIAYLYFAVMANIDLVDGRFALHMDERVTFDGVGRILNPSGWGNFFLNVLDGGDHRYGRILWNSMAAVSVVPASLFGEQGQIIASRMLQVLLLISGFVIYAHDFVTRWWLRLVLLVALLSMPYCDYYMTMPKPEPLQIFLLALFLHFYKKNNLHFGACWFLLGITFGAKISTLPAVFVFVLVSYFRGMRDAHQAEDGRARRALAFFLMGLGGAVPILLPGFIALIVLANHISNLRKWRKTPSGISLLLVVVGVVITLVLLLPQIKRWISATFLNTTHGADQASINVFSWMKYFLEEWLLVPHSLAVVFVTILGLFFAHTLWRQISSENRQLSVGWVSVMAGLALNLAIALNAHRLWGIYLFPGMVLLLVGIVSLIDSALDQWDIWNGTLCKLTGFVFPLGVVGAVAYISLVFWMPASLDNLEKLAARTKSAEYTLQLATYRQVLNVLQPMESSGKAVSIALDPILFPPSNSAKLRFTDFWGPYVDWEQNTDVLIFSKVHTPLGRECIQDSPVYHACLKEEQGYRAYVVSDSKPCVQTKCYRRISVLPEGGEILLMERNTLSADGNS